MSFKKSKLDLLVRVRYSNPLPSPPCPPKLLEIPTDPMRYARPEFLDAIANDTPLPMIVDAECGMPLDLGMYESLWEDDADESALNPDANDLPPMDPKDAFLLLDPATSSTPYTNGSSSVPSTPLPLHVPWLRKTEYISREGIQRVSSIQEPQHVHHTVDVSRGAQLQTIEASFTACNGASPGSPSSSSMDLASFDLASMRHPNKPHVTAVESYEVLPDADIWANAYDLFRFSERPGERPVDVEDPRLDCAILRPMESDGDHFLAYYLTKDDESAFTFKDRRFVPQLQTTPEERESAESTPFHFVRDYETVKVEQDVPNEFLLVLDDGDEAEVKSPPSETARRVKGAYYKNIERKMNLKKKRVIVHEIYDQKWDVIHIRHGAMDKEEEAEREELLAEIKDPDYLLGRDADGEAEADFDADGVSDSRGVMTQDGNRDVDVDVDVEGMGVSVSISEVDVFG